jgi:hypothetical protein
MVRPPSDLDDHLDWQERIESHTASGLSIDEFCLREGVSRSNFCRWSDRLKDGIPESLKAESNQEVSWGLVSPASSTLAAPFSVDRKAHGWRTHLKFLTAR